MENAEGATTSPQLELMIGGRRGTCRFTDKERYKSVRQLSSHFDPVFILAYATEVFPYRNVQSRGPKVFTKIHRLKRQHLSRRLRAHLLSPRELFRSQCSRSVTRQSRNWKNASGVCPCQRIIQSLSRVFYFLFLLLFVKLSCF